MHEWATKNVSQAALDRLPAQNRSSSFSSKDPKLVAISGSVRVHNAELGRVSLQCQRHVNILNFFAWLSSLDSQRYARKAFSMLINDVGNGHDNWVSHACDLRLHYEIQHSDTHSIIKTKVNKYFELEVFRRLNEHITKNRKLSLYASFKKNFKFESYLDYIKDFTARCTLAKLRMSAHNLQIETG